MSSRVMIAGTNSGCGKTTIVCGILAALKRRGLKVSSFKCGPDYIDPMFHKKVLDIPSYNLDSFLMSSEVIGELLAQNSEGTDISVIEGVMGYYDGLGLSDEASSHSIAVITDTPVILVVNAKGASRSILATVKGFVSYASDSKIVGVIFNNLSGKLYDELKRECERLGVKALGYVPPIKDASIGSRHLGLIQADELENIHKIIDTIADQVEKSIDIDGIINIAAKVSTPVGAGMAGLKSIARIGVDAIKSAEDIGNNECQIAIARDEAFSFYYEDNIKLLESYGAKIVYFSPLHDEKLPDNIGAVIFGGGYPELHAKELADNVGMLNDIRTQISKGLVTYAECGGFMYLHDSIKTPDGARYNMVGTIDGDCEFTDRLVHFGYTEMKALEDNIICDADVIIRGHEFHRCISTATCNGFDSYKRGRDEHWNSFVCRDNLVAGFPHIHFYNNRSIAERLVSKAKEYLCTSITQ